MCYRYQAEVLCLLVHYIHITGKVCRLSGTCQRRIGTNESRTPVSPKRTCESYGRTTRDQFNIAVTPSNGKVVRVAGAPSWPAVIATASLRGRLVVVKRGAFVHQRYERMSWPVFFSFCFRERCYYVLLADRIIYNSPHAGWRTYIPSDTMIDL